jgi:hypothetical protein
MFYLGSCLNFQPGNLSLVGGQFDGEDEAFTAADMHVQDFWC